MTALHSNVASESRRNGRTAQRAAKKKSMRRILAAVDGSERTNGIVDYLISLAETGGLFEVIILNVQPLSENWRLRGYGSFKREEVRDRLVTDLGMPIVQGVGRRLKRVGMDFTAQVEIGDPAETIVRSAVTERCDLIVVGDPRPGPLRLWIARHTGIVFGSVAGNVAQLSEKPVMIAK